MTHKIVCWGDYAIPIPVDYNWMAWDANGQVWMYGEMPLLQMLRGNWAGGKYSCRISEVEIPPPEPGPWYEQLWWIK